MTSFSFTPPLSATQLATDSKGLYTAPSYPQILGNEGSGFIVKLPTDENVLNDPRFKVRNYRVGSKVVIVRLYTFKHTL